MTLVRLFSTACLAAALSAALPAAAQQRIQVGDLVNRLNALEAEVARLRVAPRAGGGASLARLDQIEAELRRVTGLVERLDFEQRQARTANAERMKALEERLNALEDRGSAVSVAPERPAEDRPPATVDTAADAPLYQPYPGANAGPDAPDPYRPAPPPVAASGQSAQALYDEGIQLLQRGSYDRAGAQFESLVAAHEGDPLAGQAQFWLGDMHFRLGRYEQAATAFLASFRGWPEGPKAADSLLKLGMTLATIGKTEEACLSFSQVPARYPSASPSLLRRAEIESQRARCGG